MAINNALSSVSDLPVIKYEKLPPSSKGEVRALARIGYSVEEALADLIDNSIDAGAKNILVQFLHIGDEVKRVVVGDDGKGMEERRLHESMRIGAESNHKASDLGKYGTGMKTASFSQAQRMTVLSRAAGVNSGRSWELSHAESGWDCGTIDPHAARALLDKPWSGLDLGRNGTLIIWDDVDRLKPRKVPAEQYLKGVSKHVGLHLGMVYHKFLEKKKVKIVVEVRRDGRKNADFELEVMPVNPFKYPESGNPHYPRTFTIKLNGEMELKAVAHVWPKNSSAIEYKLGSGKVAARQGFYFYRNDRLIQAGGWNGVINQNDEPHLSLARVEIALPEKMDDDFGLRVQKSAVVVPAGFGDAVEAARDGSLSFEGYRGDARAAYGRAAPKPIQDLPVVIGQGIHQNIRNRVIKEFGEGGKRFNKVRFKWSYDLEDGTFFRIDTAERQILLNHKYRSAFGGTSAEDGGMMKALLFMLLRNEFQKKKTSAKRDELLSRINDVLLAAWHSR